MVYNNTPTPTHQRFRPSALALLMLTLGAGADTPPPHPLDWIPEAELTEEQRTQMRRNCCGAYISPERTDDDAQRLPVDSPMRISADDSDVQRETLINLYGDVEVLQGYRSLQADQMQIDQTTQEAEIEGDIRIREPGLLLRADRARLAIESGDAELENAQFVIQDAHIRGEARRLERFGDRLVRLESSRFTSCTPDSNTWYLSGQRINIYPEEHYGTAINARLSLWKVPVFYTPYIWFPVGDHRQTGFLPPSLSESRRNGVEVSVPFYWNIDPQYDLTLTANYMSERGILWDMETRHLSNLFETTLSGSFIESDRGGFNRRLENEISEGLITPEEAYPFRGKDRWAYNLSQTGGQGAQRWATDIDYTELSDRNYLHDLNSGSLDVNRQAQVRKHGSTSYRSDHWLLRMSAEEIRYLSTTQQPYRELPRTQADGNYRLGDWQIDLLNEYTRFDLNHFFDGNPDNVILGERLRTDYRMTWDKEWLWGFFKPGVGVRTLSYELEGDNLVAGANTSPRLATPQATLDTGLFFERSDNLFGHGYTQTLEPRLFYFYSDYDDHSDLFGLTANNRFVDFDTTEPVFNYGHLFRTTRFSGGDRLDDANQLSIGITTRFIEDRTGIERLSLGIGQIFYFADRRVTRSGEIDESDYSGIATQVQAQVGNNLLIRHDLVYNPDTDKVDNGSLGLRYMDEQYRLFNIGYRYTRNPPALDRFNPGQFTNRSLDQIDASMLWPLSNQWSLIARYNYDFTYKRELYTFAGLEYDDCCYRIRLLARRWLDFNYTPDLLAQVTNDDYDRGIVFDIQFKGLGSINDKITSLLDRAIIGYGMREKALHQ